MFKPMHQRVRGHCGVSLLAPYIQCYTLRVIKRADGGLQELGCIWSIVYTLEMMKF